MTHAKGFSENKTYSKNAFNLQRLLKRPSPPPTDCPSNRPTVVTPTDDVFGQQPYNNDEWQKGTTSFSEPDTQPHRRFPRITVLCTISILFRPSFPCDIWGRVPVTMQLLLLLQQILISLPPPSTSSTASAVDQAGQPTSEIVFPLAVVSYSCDACYHVRLTLCHNYIFMKWENSKYTYREIWDIYIYICYVPIPNTYMKNNEEEKKTVYNFPVLEDGLSHEPRPKM